MPTFYDELGVRSDVEQAELKKAMKKKALEVHPDKHPKEEEQAWTEKFKHLQQIMETFEDESSRAVYDEIHLRKERTERLLVLMDMNGSLLCKLGMDGKDGRPPPGARGADWQDKNNRFWLRPHVREFLTAVLNHPKIAFAIYTSREMRNAQPQVNSLFQIGGCGPLQRRLFAIFAGGAFSIPDPAAGPYKSKRSLPNIWRDVRCATHGSRFDECNTVNLDNERSKLKDHLDNGILVPNFGARELGKEDNTLLLLKDYLVRMADESHGDVRAYLKLFPFAPDGPMVPRSLPPVEEFLDRSKGTPDDCEQLAEQMEQLNLAESAAASEPSPESK